MSVEGRARPWEDPRRTLKRHGLTPKRRFSQNFLVSRSAVERIAKLASQDLSSPVIVELGAGLGTLTSALIESGARIFAVDRDEDMLRVLREDFAAESRLTVTEGDAASVDFSALTQTAPVRLTGNLPYAISGAILRNIVRQRRALDRALLMVQREVAIRICASPGSKTYGALSVFVQAGFEARSAFRVRPGSFHPPPKVDSEVIELRARAEVRAEETTAFQSVVRAAFAFRRKTLRRAFASAGDARLSRALELSGFDGGRRGETLSIEEFALLASLVEGDPA